MYDFPSLYSLYSPYSKGAHPILSNSTVFVCSLLFRLLVYLFVFVFFGGS